MRKWLAWQGMAISLIGAASCERPQASARPKTAWDTRLGAGAVVPIERPNPLARANEPVPVPFPRLRRLSVVELIAEYHREQPHHRLRVLADLAMWGREANQAVPLVMPLLKHADPRWRGQAAETLGAIGCANDETVGALARLLDDSCPRVSAQALAALCRQGEGAIPVLRQRQPWRPAWVDETQVRQLADLGPSAIDLLNPLLRHPDANIRWQTTRALARWEQHAARAVPELIRLVHDHDVFVRRGAVDVLGIVGPKAQSAVPALLQALSDQDAEVRWLSCYALGRSRATAPEVIAALSRCLKDDYPGVRNLSAWALGELGSPAKPALAALATLRHDREAYVRDTAARAVRNLQR